MREAELAEVFDRIWAKSSTRNWIIGRLGVYDGTPEEIDVEGRPGYVRVSTGNSGDQGVTIAKDAVGAARIVFQEVRMRRELGELVIREAAAYAGGTSGGGGGGGALDDLSDVVISTPSNGQIIQYNGTSWVNVTGGAGMAAHDLSGAYHTGLLDWVDVNKAGSSLAHLATRNHDDLDPASITTDQHHAKNHPLVGPEHASTGLTPGYSVIATTPTTFAWAQAKHTDLDPASVLPDQHHFRAHDIITGDALGAVHTITGSAFQVVGATATNTLGLLTASHDPGATEKLLKTSSNGSLFLDTNLLYVDAAGNRVGINRTTSNAALDIIVSANADHTQRIKQKSGQTGRMWRIEDIAGNELIVLDTVGNLQSGQPGFVSGLTGWRITPGGNAEFNNIWARGELHASVFVKDEVHATGGTLLVATVGKLYADAIIDSSTADLEEFEVDSAATAFPGVGVLPLTIEETSGAFLGTTLSVQGIGNVILIEDPPSGSALYFQPNEILRVKTEIDQANPVAGLRLSDLWLEVMSGTLESGYSSYNVIKRSGTDSKIPAGTAVVSYGKRGDGRILLTSDWGNNEVYEERLSPYIDVFTTGQNPWAGGAGDIIPHMRMGQLQGIGLPGVSGVPQWGMITGQDLTDSSKGYLIASNQQLALYRVPIRTNDGTYDTGLWQPSGSLTLGADISVPGGVGFKYDAATGDVWIGNTSQDALNYLHWNQALKTLYIIGNLSIGGGGAGYVNFDDLDEAVGVGVTESQDYSDYRKIVRVTGTWTTGTNTITWSGVTLYFAKGAARSVTNGTTTVPAARRYLYINWTTGTGTFAFVEKTGTDATLDANHILIAVCDPGVATAGVFGKDVRASVHVVAGGVYISGGNIFANAISTNHIASGSIETTHFSTTPVTGAKAYIDAKQTNATAYGDRRRITSVGGTPGFSFGDPVLKLNTNFLSWSGLTVNFGDGATQTITDNTAGITISGSFQCTYLYIDINDVVGATTLYATTSFTALEYNHVLVGVAEPAVNTSIGGSGWPTLQVTAGRTFISGDRIVTGSIVANNIAANAITAGKIMAGQVTADKINVNSEIAVAAGGAITGNGKNYGPTATSGFFLGHDATGTPGYKFDIGNDINYLRWDGSNLSFRTTSPIVLTTTTAIGSAVINFIKTGVSPTGILQYGDNGSARLRYNNDFVAPSCIGENAVITLSDRMRITTQRDILVWDSPGVQGDISWFYNTTTAIGYLYICVATNAWKRIPIPSNLWST